MRRFLEQNRMATKKLHPSGKKTWRWKIKTFFLCIGIISVLSSGVIAFINRQKLVSDLIQMSGKIGLTLEQIKVSGRAHTPKKELLKAVDKEIGQPIFTVNLNDVHRKIGKIGWVESAIVERRFPSTILITIRERIPIALLQTNKSHKLIDRNGTVIEGVNPHQFTHLKVVAGKAAGKNANYILSILKTEPELFSEVWAVSYRSQERWDVHLRTGSKFY